MSIRSRSRRWKFAAAFSGVLALGACSYGSGHKATDGTPRFTTAASATTHPGDARTLRIVAAAQSFLATLTPEQRAAAMFAFDDQAQRARWSNLPEGLFDRSGLRWADLTPTQQAGLRDVLGGVLSPKGLKMVDGILAADNLLDDSGPVDRIVDRLWGIQRGSGWYYVAFLGEPSADRPWTLQFGGHHLAINATVVGPNVTLAPTFTGAEPVRFVADGRRFDLFGEETAVATRLFDSLTDAQRGEAVLAVRRPGDVVLGPGQDGVRLSPGGLAGRDMDDAQKALLLALVEARMGLLNADDLAPKRARAREDLDDTRFAWLGPAPHEGAGYWRVVGPRVFVESSPQRRGGDPSNHIHAMYREPGNDYGSAWLDTE